MIQSQEVVEWLITLKCMENQVVNPEAQHYTYTANTLRFRSHPAG